MNASVRLLEEALPTTVHLHVTVAEEHPAASVLGTERAGSGALVDAAGIIVTVNYVVLGARTATVTLLDGHTHRGDVIAQDFASGIALLKIPGDDHPALPVREGPDVELGDDVCILAAVGDSGRRASAGGVTSLGGFDANWEYSLERAIFSTAMNPGLGGGPLIDVRGRLIGVVSLNLNEIGRFSLAIPIAHYRDHRAELLRCGRRASRPSRAWLGVYCQTQGAQVLVAGVLPGGPAESGGLVQGDVIRSVEGRGVGSRGELYAALWERRAGEPVRLEVQRDGRRLVLELATGDVEEFFA
jgi:S1-C subfamily serine protease